MTFNDIKERTNNAIDYIEAVEKLNANDISEIHVKTIMVKVLTNKGRWIMILHDTVAAWINHQIEVGMSLNDADQLTDLF